MTSPRLPRAAVRADVACALREDIGGGDLSAGLVSRAATMRFDLICRAPTTLCGAAWFERCFLALDKNARFVWRARDGDDVARDFLVCEVAGKARALLSAERAALNFLQTLSATAHSARRFARAAKGRIVVLDTRKTLPKLRRAQKYAVAVGGAQNHRAGLYDEILIKENHIRAAGGIEAALAAARRIAPPSEIEIEVEDLAQLEAALAAGRGAFCSIIFRSRKCGGRRRRIEGAQNWKRRVWTPPGARARRFSRKSPRRESIACRSGR